MLNKLKQCLFCKKIFDRPLRSIKGTFKISWNEYRRRKFCSMKCNGKWLSKNNIKKKNPNWRGGKTKCIDCNKELASRYTCRKTIRCKKCWNKFLKNNPEKNPNWKGGNHCIDCNKSIYSGQKRCWDCWTKFNRGKNHHSYKEKLSYKHLHRVIRKEYGNPRKCELCNKIGNNRQIHWANKTGKYLRDRKDWLSLCVSCHKKYDLKLKS